MSDHEGIRDGSRLTGQSWTGDLDLSLRKMKWTRRSIPEWAEVAGGLTMMRGSVSLRCLRKSLSA